MKEVRRAKATGAATMEAEETLAMEERKAEDGEVGNEVAAAGTVHACRVSPSVGGCTEKQ